MGVGQLVGLYIRIEKFHQLFDDLVLGKAVHKEHGGGSSADGDGAEYNIEIQVAVEPLLKDVDVLVYVRADTHTIPPTVHTYGKYSHRKGQTYRKNARQKEKLF